MRQASNSESAATHESDHALLVEPIGVQAAEAAPANVGPAPLVSFPRVQIAAAGAAPS